MSAPDSIANPGRSERVRGPGEGSGPEAGTGGERRTSRVGVPGLVRLGLRLLGIAVAVTLIAMGLHHLAHERVLARAEVPGGVEMCLVQRCNWGGEPFTTTFLVRRPGGVWQGYYYDHEDSYWGRARAELDVPAGVARFYRGESLAVTYAWAADRYTLHRRNRSQDGPSWALPPGWEPGR